MINPNNWLAIIITRKVIKLRIGEFERAQEVLQQAHALYQRDAKTLEQTGRLLFESGRPQAEFLFV